MKGQQCVVDVVDVIGAPKDSSSIVTYERNIGRKILPFLRGHVTSKKPDFKVTDLITFGSPSFTTIQEEMVIECNKRVGKTSAVDLVSFSPPSLPPRLLPDSLIISENPTH